jgi:outer membrane protein OmpA-like peptidoglycan-associated protein
LRESIPVEAILKAYMDETVEEDVIEEVNEQIIEEPIKQRVESAVTVPQKAGLSFNDIDYIRTEDGSITNVSAPKSIDRLEQISQMRSEQRKLDEEDDDDNIKLNISGESFNLDSLDVHNIEEPQLDLLPDLLIDDIEVLE